jgi:DNA-binding NtrC family response regulator
MSQTPAVPSHVDRHVGIVCSAQADLGPQLERETLRLGYRSTRTSTLHALLEEQPGAIFDAILVEPGLLGPDPVRRLKAIGQLTEPPAVLLLATEPEARAAYDLIGLGATDVIRLPFHPRQLALRIGRALEQRDLDSRIAGLEQAISERSRRSFAARTLVTESPAMRQLSITLERVAPLRTTVLVQGESGVGKELVARALHFRSPRSDSPFIAINCAALPQHLIESELFGHERGAFTGAVARRAGKFELAHRGTLFLDEIGETDPATQAKLLRVLEHQEFMRVGGSRPVLVDVRLIAATNADLEQLVRSGRFREDLYYRLKVVTLSVPPLRDRREDIGVLVEGFLQQLCQANNLHPRRVSAEAMNVLVRYPWPGNVRELVNTLEAILVSSTNEEIQVSDLPPGVLARFDESGRSSAISGRSLADMEAEAIRATLASCDGSRTRAAALLGIGVRTLRRRIQELGLNATIPAKPGRPRRG